MLNINIAKLVTFLSFILLYRVFIPSPASAHCDSMDGPVVKAAQQALKAGNVNLVLIWVKPEQESEIRTAFRKTLAVRNTNEQVREMADMYFFETLVRLHRASEGAPYTGLKPAGTDYGPAIPAAEQALKSGSIHKVRDLLMEALEKGLHEHFRSVYKLKKFNPNDVEAGRKYVEAYINYIHFVEPIYEAASPGLRPGTAVHDH